MDKNIRLAFVWDFTVNPIDLHSWNDGLSMALKRLSYDYGWTVKIIAHDDPNVIHAELESFSPDIILAWGSLDRPSFSGLKKYNVPAGLCFAGGPTEHPHTEVFDVIFVESETYEKAFKEQGVNVVRAFGTNEVLFQPMKLAKKWEAFYPAAFAKWKRHELFCDAVGSKGLVVGRMHDHEMDIVDYCKAYDVMVLPQLPYYVLPYLYNSSEVVLITASSIGGSQRSVLEAMACNVVPIVTSDNEKTSEYVKDSGFGVIAEPNKASIKKAMEDAKNVKGNGRNYILDKYSSEIYAKKLYETLNTLLG